MVPLRVGSADEGQRPIPGIPRLSEWEIALAAGATHKTANLRSPRCREPYIHIQEGHAGPAKGFAIGKSLANRCESKEDLVRE